MSKPKEGKVVRRGDAVLERSIQAATIRKLNLGRPHTLVRCRSADSVGHVAGDADIYGSIGGFHVEIEVKTPLGVPTKKQWYELREWASRGACCAITTSADEALAFQQEVLAGRGQGCILVFGKSLEQVRQGIHGGGKQVPFTVIDRGHSYEILVGPGA